MSYSQYPATMNAPQQRSTDDRATWALIAVVVLLVAGGVGWLVARESNPSWDDAEQYARMAAAESSMQGRDRGWNEGAKAGRREARLQAELKALQQRPSAWSEGWRNGLRTGRDQSSSRYGGFDPYVGGSASGAYPAEGYQDVMSELFDDPPGYSSSSLSGVSPNGTAGYGSQGGGSLSELYGGSGSY